MILRSCAVLAVLLAGTPAFGEPPGGAATSAQPRSIRLAIDAEVARLTARPAPPHGLASQGVPARRANWVQRHPVRTAAIAGFLSCFAIGWAAGDDAVFDDFTGEFNGVLLGGICAGSAATVVRLVQAVRRPPAPGSGRAASGTAARSPRR